jgi:hypothetical protein
LYQLSELFEITLVSDGGTARSLEREDNPIGIDV